MSPSLETSTSDKSQMFVLRIHQAIAITSVTPIFSRIKAIGVARPSFVSVPKRLRADPSDPIGSNGREANYLEAFSRRNSARTRADLDGLDELIASARNIYHLELELVSQSGDSEWPHDPVPERFMSEELALAMTKHFFDWARASANMRRMGSLSSLPTR